MTVIIDQQNPIEFRPDGRKIADEAIVRCFDEAIASVSTKFNLAGRVSMLQERERTRALAEALQALFYDGIVRM